MKIVNRNLDTVYFRVYRDGKWQNLSFSDLTDEEMDEVLEDKGLSSVKSLAKILGKTLRQFGDELEIIGRNKND